MIAKLKDFWAWLQGWKTYVVSGLIAFAGIALEIADSMGAVDITALLPPKYAPYGAIGMALLMGWLRSVTKTPAGKKE